MLKLITVIFLLFHYAIAEKNGISFAYQKKRERKKLINTYYINILR